MAPNLRQPKIIDRSQWDNKVLGRYSSNTNISKVSKPGPLNRKTSSGSMGDFGAKEIQLEQTQLSGNLHGIDQTPNDYQSPKMLKPSTANTAAPKNGNLPRSRQKFSPPKTSHTLRTAR
jgi:hypothetical protein